MVRNKGSKTGLSENLCKFYFGQLVQAVRYMHANKICHRDLKMENILISDK